MYVDMLRKCNIESSRINYYCLSLPSWRSNTSKYFLAASADVSGWEVRAGDPGGAGRELAADRGVGAGGGRGGPGAGHHRHPRGRGLQIRRALRQMGRTVQVPPGNDRVDTSQC